MPIKGLQTDQPGLPRAGIIRLGYRKISEKTGKEYPVEADHFVLTDAPGLAEALGTDRPTELEIFFPFDDINLVFPAYMQHWIASALVCRGDGEQIIYAINPQTGQATVRDGVALVDHIEGKQTYKAGAAMACPGTDRNLYPKCEKCKPNAMLIVLLRNVPRLAYYQIATTSIHNIVELTQQLNTCLDNLENITGQRRLTGVPFILKRITREISAPKTDRAGNPTGRQRVKKHLLSLEIDPDWVMRMFKAQRQLADPMARFAIPATVPEARQEIIEPEPAPQRAPFGFAEPPAWEPPIEEPEFKEVPEEAGADMLAFATIDDLLFQLHIDFNLKEGAARAKLKELKFNGLPRDEAARRVRLIEMYLAVKKDVETLRQAQDAKAEAEAEGTPVQDEIDF